MNLDEQLLKHQREAEVSFAACAYAGPENLVEEFGYLQPDRFVDNEIREWWRAIRAGEDTTKAAIDQKILHRLVGHLNEYNLSFFQKEVFAATIQEDIRLREFIEVANRLVQAVSRRDIDAAGDLIKGLQLGVIPRSRYIVRKAADALEGQPPIDYVVDGLITAGSVNVVYGEPGSKKTYALISLAVCVAGALPWLDFTVTPSKALIIDEESGDRRLARRIGEALRGEECGPDTPLSYISLAGFKLDNAHDPAILQALIEAERPGLVIIDALADVMDGDENSKQETQPVFNALRKIAEQTNAAIILIHHANKNGGYRGSSAIKGAVDAMIQVESESGKNTITFTCEKTRDDLPQEWGAVATWIDDRFTLRPCSIQETGRHYSKSEDYVIRYLEEHGESSLPDIEGAADTCSPEAARRAVYSLAQKRKTYRTNPGAKGTPAIYDLVREDVSLP